MRGNVRCEGLQEGPASGTRYLAVWVGTPQEPYTGVPVLTLGFGDGTVVRTDQIDVSWLRARADRSAPRRASGYLVEQGWPEGSEEIAVAGYRFVVRSELMLGFGIEMETAEGEFKPELGDANGEVFFRAPFRQKDLVALFGQPEAVRKKVAGGLL